MLRRGFANQVSFSRSAPCNNNTFQQKRLRRSAESMALGVTTDIEAAVAKNDRLRSPVKPDYVDALGRAAFIFATCEWQVVWCCEKISPGALKKIVGEELTAGKIAKRFIDICRNMPRSKEREELLTAATRFSDLVVVRNNILHGKPCTGPNGEARLSGSGVIEISDLEDAADSFLECSSQLNALFYGFLSTYRRSSEATAGDA